MKKTFTINGTEYTVSTCTAIHPSDLDRQDALLVTSCENRETFEHVVFGYQMPDSEKDFEIMSNDPYAWDFDHETLATVQPREVYFMADAEYADAIYGDQHHICLNQEEIQRLAREWGMTEDELMEKFHEASASEIEEHGIY